MRFRATVSAFGIILLAGCAESDPLKPPQEVPPAPLATFVPAQGFTFVEVGDDYACALNAAGAATCFRGGSLPGSTSPPPDLFQSISVGIVHGCGIKQDDAIACWGYNGQGQLNGVPTATGYREIVAGGNHTCALKLDGSIVCWGSNSDFQLVGVPTETGFTQVVAGGSHSCALAADGSIRCWGRTGAGSPENDTPVGIGFRLLGAGAHVTCALTSDGHIRCWGNNSRGELNGIPTTGGFVRLSVGFSHSCALRDDATIACWGDGASGQLNRIPTDDGYFMMSSYSSSTCALKQSDGTLHCWGEDFFGEVSRAPTQPGFTTISAGAHHMCALAADTSIRCWGRPDLPLRIGTTLLPTADLSAPVTVPEGSDIILTLTNPQVPGYTGSPTFEYAFNCGTGTGPYGPANSYACPTVDNGQRYVRSYVRDQDGDEASYLSQITVTNVPPTIKALGDPTGPFETAPFYCPVHPELMALKVLNFSDPGSADTWSITANWGDGTATELYKVVSSPGEHFIGKCYTTPGNYNVTITVTDDDGGSATGSFSASFTNTGTGGDVVVVPVDETSGEPSPVELTFDNVTSGGETTVTSGTVGGGGGPPPPANFRLGNPPTFYNIETSATFDGSIQVCLSYTGISYGNESQVRLLHFEGGSWVNVTSPGYPDTANDIVCGTVTSLSPFLAAEQNLAPVIVSLTVPTTPTALGSAIQVSATFTDPNPGDTHAATINWGDGATSPGTVADQGGAGTVAAPHTYAATGVYVVRLTVSDGSLSDTRTTADVPAYVVVYDPNGAFVTGGGWLTSPAGALATSPSATGKAAFGFVARYQKGANTPIGNTEFQFSAGDLSFRSSSYQWLVVAGSRAQFKGDGKVGGTGDYGFLLTAIDGQLDGGTDSFRIKIWDKSTGAVIYDNQLGASESGSAATAIGGGSIVIHK